MKAEVRNPSGALTDCSVTDNADGTYSMAYTPFENGEAEINSGLVQTVGRVEGLTSLVLVLLLLGLHSVQVLYDDTPVPKSPFQVSVREGCDPTRVVAAGPGLQKALSQKPNNFNIITRWRQTRNRVR